MTEDEAIQAYEKDNPTDDHAIGCNNIARHYEAEIEEAEARGRKEVVQFIHKEFGGYIRDYPSGGLVLENILIDNEDGSLDKWVAQLIRWGL